jgi:hypothetical protein
MIGNWKWNVALGLTGMVITLLANIGSNLLFTSVLRSLYVFVLLFVFGFVIRLILGRLTAAGADFPEADSGEKTGQQDEPWKGTNIDMSTPEEDGFTPLVPPKMNGDAQGEDPAKIARVIRHMSEQ